MSVSTAIVFCFDMISGQDVYTSLFSDDGIIIAMKCESPVTRYGRNYENS